MRPSEPDAQDAPAYWSGVAGEKVFTHRFDAELFAAHVRRDARVLDLGCGYGRVTAELHDQGWSHVLGADRARGMIERARREHPRLAFALLDGPELPFESGAFDAVVLFSVLTCIPVERELERLMTGLHRILAPDGRLYASDLLLQEDARNLERYAEGERRTGIRGVFDLPRACACDTSIEPRCEGSSRGFASCSSRSGA